jgi:hypothetical protein
LVLEERERCNSIILSLTTHGDTGPRAGHLAEATGHRASLGIFWNTPAYNFREIEGYQFYLLKAIKVR